jgi:hypothetical protein
MKRRIPLIGAALASLALLAPHAAPAQTLDSPLRIVVGYAPGGSSDRVARIVGDKLQAKLGIPVVVENKTGAGGRLAAQQVKATPAGQSVLMLANPAVMVVAPLVFKDNGYDAERDFTPVSQVNDYEFGLAVATAVPVRELSHLVAWLRSNPEKANFGVPATGSLPHFFALMTAEKAGVQAQVIGYRGSGPLLTDLIGGQVPVAFDRPESGGHRLEHLLRPGHHAEGQGGPPGDSHPRRDAGPRHPAQVRRRQDDARGQHPGPDRGHAQSLPRPVGAGGAEIGLPALIRRWPRVPTSSSSSPTTWASPTWAATAGATPNSAPFLPCSTAWRPTGSGSRRVMPTRRSVRPRALR